MRSKYILSQIILLSLVGICLVGSIVGQQTRAITPVDSASDSGLGGGNAIEGTVLLPSGQQLDRRIRVRLATMTKGDTSSMTDDHGKFVFRSLVGGDYTIVIDGEKEFEPVSHPVSILQFRGAPSQVALVSIKLTARRDIEPKAGVVNAELVNVPPKALEFYNKALELSKERDHKGAIEQLQQAVKEFPDFMLGYNEMGYQYLKITDYEKAAEAFQNALKIKSDAIMPLINYGIVLTCQNKFKEAEVELRKAIKLDEKSAVAHYYLAYSVANQSRFDEGEKEFLNAIKLGGDLMKEAHRYLAIIYSSRGDKKHQIAELETYLQLAPNVTDAEQLRTLLQKLKGGDSTAAKPNP